MAAAIYTAVFGFALGVAFETFSNADIFVLLLIALIVLALAAEMWFLERKPNAPFALLFLCFITFFFFGALRYATYSKAPDTILADAKGKVEIVGIVSQDPDERTDKTLITLRVESADGQKVSGENNILIEAGLFPQRFYGQEIEVAGELVLPKNFSDDETGETFDYVSYLKKDRIYFIMYEPQTRLLAENKGNPIVSALLLVKHAFENSVDKNVSEPNASLISAIIVGARHSVPQNILDMLRLVGIIHIVILSGYAITIVAESVRRFFSRFGFRASIILASISIVLFALMTGAGAMVVRASIMALLAFLSKALSRKHDVVRALALTLFVMVLWNPMILVFDTSFQTSLLAVCGLIFVSPIFEKKFTKVSASFGFKEIFISTLAAQIFVLPYIIYITGNLSLFAVPANLFVLIVLPMTMLFGMLSGVVGMISSILAFPFSAMAYFLTSYELFIAKFFSAIPFSSINIPMPFWAVLIIYAILIFFVRRFYRKEKSTAPF